MTKITEYMYLGDVDDARKLKEGSSKYDCIINLYADSINDKSYRKFKHIPVIYVNIEDNESENIAKYFKYLNDVIQGVERRGEKVLIHCRAGVSRSASVVIAYLMYRYKLNLEEAFEYVKNKRPQIDPNYGFLKRLKAYEKVL